MEYHDMGIKSVTLEQATVMKSEAFGWRVL